VPNLRFEWDEAKNLANQRKHGIRFERAIEVFNDPLYLQILDRVENGEERWQTFGLIKGRLLLMVVHTIAEELEDGMVADTIRIISARDATPRERVRYENENS
jgi:uncharacterized DUF497 family protein